MVKSAKEADKPETKYKCSVCPYVERYVKTPYRICENCRKDYLEIKDLADRITERIGFVHLDASPTIKKQLNLLVGEVNELRTKVRRLGL